MNQIISLLLSNLGRESAYLDPGSGSFIVQMLIAGLVGAGFLLRGFWGKLFGKRKESDTDEDEIFDDTEDL
jgi:hypothetical protein